MWVARGGRCMACPGLSVVTHPRHRRHSSGEPESTDDPQPGSPRQLLYPSFCRELLCVAVALASSQPPAPVRSISFATFYLHFNEFKLPPAVAAGETDLTWVIFPPPQEIEIKSRRYVLRGLIRAWKLWNGYRTPGRTKGIEARASGRSTRTTTATYGFPPCLVSRHTPPCQPQVATTSSLQLSLAPSRAFRPSARPTSSWRTHLH